jgi:fucose permease
MFIVGLITAMPGALFGIPAFRVRLAIDLAQQGDIFLLLYGGVLVSTLIAGPAIESYGNKSVLASCAVIAAVSFAAFANVRSFYSAMAVAFVLGLGGGPLNTAANALVAEIFAADRRASMLSLVHSFFGVGALAAALLATRVASVPLLWISAAFVAACGVFYMTLVCPPPQVTTGFSFRSFGRAARLAGVMVLAAICFCESGNEASLGGWISTYAGPWALVAYLLPFTLSRLTAAKFASKVPPLPFVIGCAALAAAGCALVIAYPPYALAGAVIAGIAVAPVYPAVLSVAADRHGTAGSVFGLLFAVGLTGAVVFPFAVGHISQTFGMRAGMSLPLLGALTIVCLGYAAGKRTSKTAPPPSAFMAPTDPP